MGASERGFTEGNEENEDSNLAEYRSPSFSSFTSVSLSYLASQRAFRKRARKTKFLNTAPTAKLPYRRLPLFDSLLAESFEKFRSSEPAHES